MKIFQVHAVEQRTSAETWKSATRHAAFVTLHVVATYLLVFGGNSISKCQALGRQEQKDRTVCALPCRVSRSGWCPGIELKKSLEQLGLRGEGHPCKWEGALDM